GIPPLRTGFSPDTDAGGHPAPTGRPWSKLCFSPVDDVPSQRPRTTLGSAGSHDQACAARSGNQALRSRDRSRIGGTPRPASAFGRMLARIAPTVREARSARDVLCQRLRARVPPPATRDRPATSRKRRLATRRAARYSLPSRRVRGLLVQREA